MKKYELLANEEIIVNGTTLYRIRALRDFGDVKEGDLGGYIEKESNLAHEGNCWVHDDAGVFGNAQVGGNALVSGNAQVSCYAQVFGNAQVRGNVRIFGETVVAGGADISKQSDFVVFSNVGSENGTLTVFRGIEGNPLATRGCFSGTVEEFLAKSKQVHDERVHREYQLLIEVAKSRILGGNR